jgi:hypothetical protein
MVFRCRSCNAYLVEYQAMPYNDIHLCETCQRSRNILMPTSTATRNYCLQESDLTNLPKNLRHGAAGRVTKYFYYQDIRKRAVEKYGGEDKFLEEKNRRSQLSDKSKLSSLTRKHDKIEASEKRQQDVKTEMKNLKIEFPLDLVPEAQDFIKKGKESKYSIDDVVDAIRIKHFLFKYTNYLLIYYETKYDEIYHGESYLDRSSGGDLNEIPYGLLLQCPNILKQ